MERPLQVDLFDAVHGSRYQLAYPRRVVCGSCLGSRCEKHTAPSKCWTCGGKGFIQFKNAAQGAREACPKCRGGGMTIKHPCKACRGEGLVEGAGQALVAVPRGAQAGDTLRVAEGGHESCNGKPGDLLVKLDIRKDGRFWLEGADLNSHHLLSAAESVLGARTRIATLHGDYQVELAEGLRPGDKIAIRDFGSRARPKKPDREGPAQEPPAQAGAHIVHIGVRIPQRLTDRERQLYLQLARIEADRFEQLFPEDQLAASSQVHDLELKGSREHREFADALEKWKRRGEVDVFVDERMAVQPNRASVAEQLKQKLADPRPSN